MPPIIYEDNDILILNKPSGLMVHGDGRSIEKTLADMILEEYPEMRDVGEPTVYVDQKTKEEITLPRPGIVHRLDRETSGVILVAKTQEAFLHLKAQFQDRTIKKIYHTFVWGQPRRTQATITAPIGRSKNDFRRWHSGRGVRGELRDAETEYYVQDRFDIHTETPFDDKEGITKFSFLEIWPHTGRTHQIRVHLKYINHPIVSDTLYAPDRPKVLGFDRTALHASRITLMMLSGEKKTFEAPFPEDFKKALAEIKKI